MTALLVWALTATALAVIALALLVSAAAFVRVDRRAGERERERRERQHEREMQRMQAQHDTVLERLANVLNYGTPTPKEAVVADPEPDAELRVRQRVREDTVRAGIIALTREYERMGMKLSEEEVREEVLAMLDGQSPRPTHALPVAP